VSRTFRSPGLIRQETRDKVLAAAKRLNYRPSVRPNGSERKRSADTIGFQFFASSEDDPVYNNGYYGPVLAGAQAEAADRGVHLMMHATNRHTFVERLPRMIEDRRVQGMLLVGIADTKILRIFSEHVPHIVLVDNPDPSGRHDCVMPDGFGGMYDASRHLLDLGHQDIVFYGDNSGSSTFRDRFHGYLCAMFDAGVTPKQQFIVPMDVTDRVGAVCDFLNSAERPTAIVAASDLLAMDVVKACMNLDWTVPDDLSVIGYDDIELSAMINPALTTVRVEKEYMGRLAVRRLLHHMQTETPDQPTVGQDEAVTLTVPVHLICRQSCRAIDKEP
jgi:LacI family transcriptional regulator